jgi:hypothetical protein
MMDLELPPGEDGIVTSGRPIYERPANLKDERDAIPKIERLWGCSLVKLPIAYNLDFAAVRDGRVVAWIEFKRRHRLFDWQDLEPVARIPTSAFRILQTN